MAEIFKGLGRRKSSVARVAIEEGNGKITINNKTLKTYFPNDLIIQDLEQPLVVTNTKDKFDIKIRVVGGGFSGQAGAARLGITRALIEFNPDLKSMLKAKGLVTRDARSKERKHMGKTGARRSFQFVKR
jgi:small subunit ribosomal protein S9